MDFRISALPAEGFAPLFGASDDRLAALGACRVVADVVPGYPCRVSLEDAEVGERLILLAFEHHAVKTPYRGVGPIYVREGAARAEPAVNEVPLSVRRRMLSLRGYDGRGMLIGADVVDGRDFEAGVRGLFALDEVRYIHAHNAKPGCYNCRVDRV